MENYVKVFFDGYSGYWNYLMAEILHPSWKNYFYWLLAVSLFAWLLELAFPWRKNQAAFRKDFWLDGFYIFFNFFIFSLIGYNALSNLAVELFNDFLALFGVRNLVAINLQSLPAWSQYILMFAIADFIQWNIHRLLHYSKKLWEFHKVHHSVQQMGFAAHLRFHWMETIIYKSIQYIPLAMLGFGLKDFFVIHIIALAIGHINHSNIKLTYGPLKYLINNPVMHLWHHAYILPEAFRYGANFGISLSLWDYIFGSAYVPTDDGNTKLGFEGDKHFQSGFIQQMLLPFKLVFSKRN